MEIDEIPASTDQVPAQSPRQRPRKRKAEPDARTAAERRKHKAARMRFLRQNETPEATAERRAKDNARKAAKMALETADERANRLTRAAIRRKAKLALETPEQRRQRLEKLAERKAKLRVSKKNTTLALLNDTSETESDPGNCFHFKFDAVEKSEPSGELFPVKSASLARQQIHYEQQIPEESANAGSIDQPPVATSAKKNANSAAERSFIEVRALRLRSVQGESGRRGREKTDAKRSEKQKVADTSSVDRFLEHPEFSERSLEEKRKVDDDGRASENLNKVERFRSSRASASVADSSVKAPTVGTEMQPDRESDANEFRHSGAYETVDEMVQERVNCSTKKPKTKSLRKTLEHKQPKRTKTKVKLGTETEATCNNWNAEIFPLGGAIGTSTDYEVIVDMYAEELMRAFALCPIFDLL